MKVEERRSHKEKKKFSVILVKLSVMILPKNRRFDTLKVLVSVLRERIGDCEIIDHKCVFYYTFEAKKLR
jgi:hypothetical protein